MQNCYNIALQIMSIGTRIYWLRTLHAYIRSKNAFITGIYDKRVPHNAGSIQTLFCSDVVSRG